MCDLRNKDSFQYYSIFCKIKITIKSLMWPTNIPNIILIYFYNTPNINTHIIWFILKVLEKYIEYDHFLRL